MKCRTERLRREKQRMKLKEGQFNEACIMPKTMTARGQKACNRFGAEHAATRDDEWYVKVRKELRKEREGVRKAMKD